LYIDNFASVSKWQRSKQAHLGFLERHALGKADAFSLTASELINHLRSPKLLSAPPETFTMTSGVRRAAESGQGPPPATVDRACPVPPCVAGEV
jgi:hypothetical protein